MNAYTQLAKLLKQIIEEKRSFKTVLFSNKSCSNEKNIKQSYGILIKAAKYYEHI